MSRRSRLGPGFIAAVVLLAAFFCITGIALLQEFGGSNWGYNIIVVAVVLVFLIGLGNVFYGRSSPYIRAHARTQPPPSVPPPASAEDPPPRP